MDTARLRVARLPRIWPLLAWTLAGLAVGLFLPPARIIGFLRFLHSGIDYPPDSTHSFFLAGAQSIVCARNTGLYAGAFLTMAWAWATGRGRSVEFPPLRIGLVLALFVGVMAADGLNSFVRDIGYPSPYAPMNWLRLATGLLAGAAVAAYFVPVVNSLIWREGTDQAVVPSLRSLGGLLLCLTGFWAVVVLGLDLFALPVALLTAAASFILFGSLNLIFLVLILRRDNTFLRLADLLRPGLVCLALALAELALLAWVVRGVMSAARM